MFQVPRSVNEYAVQYHYKGSGGEVIPPGLPGAPATQVSPISGDSGIGPEAAAAAAAAASGSVPGEPTPFGIYPDGPHGAELGLADLGGRKPWNDYRQNEEKVGKGYCYNWGGCLLHAACNIHIQES